MIKFILLTPLLVLQGLWVYFATVKLPEAAGERQGLLNNNKPCLKMLIVGDSAAAGVGVACQSDALSGHIIRALNNEFSFEWQLKAWTGCTTQEMHEHLKTQVHRPYDVVVTSLGVNDVTSIISAESWLQQQINLVECIREKYAPQLIIITAIPPMELFPALPQPLRNILGRRAGEFNQKLATWLKLQADCCFLKITFPASSEFIAADGFHPGASGFKKWGEAVACTIKNNFIGEQNNLE